MRIFPIAAAAAVITFCACGSSKDSTTSDKKNTAETVQPAEKSPEVTSAGAANPSTTSSIQNQMTENNQGQEKQEAVKYRLILSFISIGEGTDPKARETMDKIIQKWESKTGKKIVMETYPWGREGEVDFCFLLNELSAPDQAVLAREMREAFQQQPLIQISEHQSSMHKR